MFAPSSLRRVSIVTVVAAALLYGAAAQSAVAQNGYFAAIAYSQSTGKIGYTARSARSEQAAKQLALRHVATPDAKVFTWAQDQWVAVATADGVVGTAGFARAYNADEAQRRALAECQKSAKGGACSVRLCIHSSGMQSRELRKLPRDPNLPPLPPTTSKTGYFAAIAFSPSTGKVGTTAGKASTKAAAEKLALKDCGVKDARVFMWGDQWVAIALAEGRPGVAGFGPGVTRAAAEKAALDQCKKLAKGAKCKVELAIHSTGKSEAELAKQSPAKAPAADGPSSKDKVTPATAEVNAEKRKPAPASN